MVFNFLEHNKVHFRKIRSSLKKVFLHNSRLLILMYNFFSGASANVEGLTTNLASLKLGLHNRDGAPQLMKLLDENLQWNDTALEVYRSSVQYQV